MKIAGRPWLLRRFGFQLRMGLVAAGLVGLWIMPAWAEYRLEPGDVLEISILDVPALHTRAAIDVDGNIAFPLIGQVKAAGSSVEVLTVEIAKLLGERASGSSSSDSRRTRITSHEIMILVAEYCPVYLNGAVARPGPQPFRPGVTVRQAISLAGGVGRSVPAGADFADNGLWIDYAAQLARIWRLEAERAYLDEGTDLNVPPSKKAQVSADLESSLKSAMDGSPIPTSVLSQIVSAESDQLLLTKAAHTKERDYLGRARGEVDAQLALLLKQQANEQYESDQDAHEFDQVRALYSAKLTTTDRMSLARHQGLTASNEFLQTSSLIAQTQRERDTLDDRLRQIESDRRIAIVKEIEETYMKLAKTRESLQARAGAGLSVGERGLTGGTPAESKLLISIARETDGVPATVVGTEDTTLSPGDVVQIGIADSAAGEMIKSKIADVYPTQ
jgi:polysaccharide export outer membrane protein